MRNKPEVQTALLANAILHIRSKRAESRTALSKFMNLSPSTAGLYVDSLIENKFIVESGLAQGAKGRPKRQLAVCPDAGWFAGIEFNADRLCAVRINFDGKQIQSFVTNLPEAAKRQDIFQEIDNSVAKLSHDAPGPLMSIGVGVPGVVDPDQGIGLSYSFVPDWQNVRVVKELQERHSVSVKIDNNLRAIALAERWFGGGTELDDYAVLAPRTGFGLAIIKDGHLIRGANHRAGEIGRWHWPFEGHTGEVHGSLSAPAVWRRLTSAPVDRPAPRDLFSAFERMKVEVEQQPGWKSVVADFGRLLGYIHLLLFSERYFLHGPLRGLGETFCQAVSEQSQKLMPTLAAHAPAIVPSSMRDDAGALGAASLAMESWQPTLMKD
jgi:predicted NBD/HSP70 family sugar kinase